LRSNYRALQLLAFDLIKSWIHSPCGGYCTPLLRNAPPSTESVDSYHEAR
jgi:hypothetical protein